jgi:hypothetical protein
MEVGLIKDAGKCALKMAQPGSRHQKQMLKSDEQAPFLVLAICH